MFIVFGFKELDRVFIKENILFMILKFKLEIKEEEKYR